MSAIKQSLHITFNNGKKVVLHHPPRTWQIENGCVTLGWLDKPSLIGIPLTRIHQWKIVQSEEKEDVVSGE